MSAVLAAWPSTPRRGAFAMLAAWPSTPRRGAFAMLAAWPSTPRQGAFLLAIAIIGACSFPPVITGLDTGNEFDGGAIATPDGGVPAKLQLCTDAPFTSGSHGEWENLTTKLVVTGKPGHSAQDVLASKGHPIAVAGKFAYGSLSIDLAGEYVRGYYHDCAGWQSLGEKLTDSDGRASFAIESDLPIGIYDVRFEVVGDASGAAAKLWVLPAGTHLVVYDIDGTLTTSDSELFADIITDLFAPIFDGTYVPEAYPGAVSLTASHLNRGHVNVFLTGRPYWLTDITREWLSALGFAIGDVHTTNSNPEALPTDDGVGAYKLAFLNALKEAGFIIDLAYGNATTDIFAYLEAGIPDEQVWIIGAHGGEEGTHAVTDSWTARSDEVLAGPTVTQPFMW